MTCQHRWLIPTPDGREYLPQRCRWCGEIRSVPAAWQEPHAWPASLGARMHAAVQEHRALLGMRGGLEGEE